MTTHELEIVAVADPAGGRPTSNGARSSIVVVGRDMETDFRFVLEAWAERCYTDRLTDMLFNINRKYRPRRFGIETVSGFRLYADSVRKEAREKRINAFFVDINTNTHTHKENRIKDVLAVELSRRRLFVKPDQHDLINELKGFPATPTLDLIDALSMAIELFTPLANGSEISYANTVSEPKSVSRMTYAPSIRFS